MHCCMSTARCLRGRISIGQYARLSLGRIPGDEAGTCAGPLTWAACSSCACAILRSSQSSPPNARYTQASRHRSSPSSQSAIDPPPPSARVSAASSCSLAACGVHGVPSQIHSTQSAAAALCLDPLKITKLLCASHTQQQGASPGASLVNAGAWLSRPALQRGRTSAAPLFDLAQIVASQSLPAPCPPPHALPGCRAPHVEYCRPPLPCSPRPDTAVQLQPGRCAARLRVPGR